MRRVPEAHDRYEDDEREQQAYPRAAALTEHLSRSRGIGAMYERFGCGFGLVVARPVLPATISAFEGRARHLAKRSWRAASEIATTAGFLRRRSTETA